MANGEVPKFEQMGENSHIKVSLIELQKFLIYGKFP
jgi:hypothetical protein